jgi:transposase
VFEIPPAGPKDVDAQLRLIAAQKAELAAERAARTAAEAALAQTRLELTNRSLLIEKLKVQIARLRRMQFGRSSEKLRTELAQLELALEELETAESARKPEPNEPEKAREPRSPRRRFPSTLPREEVVHLPTTGTCACPKCGGELRRLGEDDDEMIDIEPVVLKVVRHVRPKFSCRACEAVTQAPAPDKPIARGKATFRFIGHLMVSKWDHHLPLYRQAEMLAAQGFDADRSTLAGWVGQGCALIRPIADRIRQIGLQASKLHVDDTPLPMLDPGAGKTKTARLWCHAVDDRAHAGSTHPLVWFRFTTDRRGIHPVQELQGFQGYLQADGYAGYHALYQNGTVIEVACFGHARRKIWDIHQTKPSAITTELLERIAALYKVEESIRGQVAEQRKTMRQSASKPRLEELRTRMIEIHARLSAKSEMAKAIAYSLNRWDALIRFLDDGRLEIDNLIAERALRGVAIGRRNWLFAGSQVGGERAAEIYTIIETCKLNGVDVLSYLTDVMEKVASGWPNKRLDELLPWNWRPPNNISETAQAA